MDKLIYYVYIHKKASNGEVFYVGKGSGRRATHVFGRNDYWTKTYKKYGLIVEYVKTGLSESDAFLLEIETIKKYPNLVNMNDGGTGQSGLVHSEYTKQLLSANNKGRKQPQSEIDNRVKSLRGKKRTPEFSELIASIHRGLKHSDETKAKMSASRAGKKLSESHVENIRKWHLGSKRSDEAKKRMSEASAVKRGVICIDLNIEFESLTAAQNWLRSNGHPNATKTGVCNCAKGNYKKAYGYEWKYSCQC